MIAAYLSDPFVLVLWVAVLLAFVFQCLPWESRTLYVLRVLYRAWRRGRWREHRRKYWGQHDIAERFRALEVKHRRERRIYE